MGSRVRCPPLLWEAAGRPDPRKRVHAVDAGTPCYWCGADCDGLACRTADVATSTFTDHDLAAVPESRWVCRGCTWSLTGRPPDTLRLWTIVYRDDRPAVPSNPKAPRLGSFVHATSRGALDEVASVLTDPPDGPWVCSVATSGQIHVAPHAVVNCGRGSWCVRVERRDVRSSPGELATLRSVVQELRDAGHTLADVEDGEPTPAALVRPGGIDLWERVCPLIITHRRSALLSLAAMLTRRNT